VKQKGKQLSRREVETGLSGLDLGIELLGQEPEEISSFQSPTFDGIGDAVEVLGWCGVLSLSKGCVWQFGQGIKGQELAGHNVQQEFARSVGEGAEPLPDGGQGWASIGQLFHQAAKALTSDDVEGDGVLQQADGVVPVGVQEVRKQAVGTAADLASDPLDPDVVVIVRRAGPAPVSAPTDQRAIGLALRVGTTARDRKVTARKGLCFGVLLDGIGEVLYNDHACRTPPLVVKPTSSKPQREVLFFLN